MAKAETWKKSWDLLDRRERQSAGMVLGIVLISALSATAMIGSVMPFLSVLSDPEKIRENPFLWKLFTLGEFSSDYSFLVFLGVISIVVTIGANFCQILRVWAVVRFSHRRTHSISHRLLSVYLRQPYTFFLHHHSGEMSTNILSESQQAVNQFLRPAADVIASSITLIAIVIFLLWIEPIVALNIFVILSTTYAITFVFTRKTVNSSGIRRVAENKSRYRVVNEALGGIKDIKHLGKEIAYLKRYRKHSSKMADTQIVVSILGDLPQFIVQMVAYGGIIALCLLMMTPEGLTSGNALSSILPMLGVFALAGQRVLAELSKLYRGMTQMNYGAAAVENLHSTLEYINSALELIDKPITPLGMEKCLEFRNISYRYPGTTDAGVTDLSFRIHVGEKIGIVGSTGSGKSTLADIMLGLLTSSEGLILVDGSIINSGNIHSWQRTIGYVPQQIYLVDASVTENIALGIAKENINFDIVKNSSKIAQIDQFISNDLPDGYDTAIGERGIRLSGGQRQRIGIARALYQQTDILLLDEATSALDNNTEAELIRAITSAPKSKTVITIAHRASTVEFCDRILVMNEGRLVGSGTWDELQKNNLFLNQLAQHESGL